MKLFRASVLLIASALAAQTPASNGKLTLLPAADSKVAASSAVMSLLPKHSSRVLPERKQIARLTAPGQPELWFVPVIFDHEESSPFGSSERSRCGVFVMEAGGMHQQFLWTIKAGDSDDLAVDQCGGLLAIRRSGDGPHPDLRLDYRTFAPPHAEDKVHVILSWDAKASQYKAGGAAGNQGGLP